MELKRIIITIGRALGFFLLMVVVGGLIFNSIEKVNLMDSFYWTLITMTTVGYGDISPVTYSGKFLALVLATIGIVFYGYFGSIIIEIVVDKSLAEVFGMKECKFENHYVLAGWNLTSDVVLQELVKAERQIAVIIEDDDLVRTVKGYGKSKNLYVTVGDPSNTEVLKKAKIEKASVVILATDDDTKNLVTTLHIKQKLNPKARVIVKTNRAELKDTMEIAGVTYVATPNQLSGRLIASAAFEPSVAVFVEDVTSALEGYDLQEFEIPEGMSSTVGKLSKKIKSSTGALLIAMAEPAKGGHPHVRPNPSNDVPLKGGYTVVLLGNEKELGTIEDKVGLLAR